MMIGCWFSFLRERIEMPKVLVALPSGLLEEIDEVALAEHRNRSDLIREALRRYIENFKRNQNNPNNNNYNNSPKQGTVNSEKTLRV